MGQQLAVEVIDGDLLLVQSPVASSHEELSVVRTDVYVKMVVVEISQLLETDASFLTAVVVEKGSNYLGHVLNFGEKNSFYLIDFTLISNDIGY